MTCEEFRARVVMPLEQATRADRSAMVVHVLGCQACMAYTRQHGFTSSEDRSKVLELADRDCDDDEAVLPMIAALKKFKGAVEW